jgi:two-component system C4-dicarboxylate transport response regulator DctD
VRELKNAADRFVLGIGESAMAGDEKPGGYEERMAHYERHIIREELKAAQGQLNAAAQRLNLSRKTLYRKMKKHRLDKQHYRAGDEDGS